MEKFETIILVSFGTEHMPPYKYMMKIIASIMNADSSSIGFVISIKENNEAYKEIAKMNRSNFLIESWVP